MELRELQDWFGAEELGLCPRCLEAAALALEHSDALLCFHCGYIRAREEETSVRELQSATAARAR
jgi:ribosomal protein S27AE